MGDTKCPMDGFYVVIVIAVGNVHAKWGRPRKADGSNVHVPVGLHKQSLELSTKRQ